MSEFKPGDLVETLSGFRGTVLGSGPDVYTDQTVVAIRTLDGDIYDFYSTQLRHYVSNAHTCAPYVGIIHVEPKCVHCSRWMQSDEIADYIRNKVGF
jgi:hypothetical protein